MVLASCGPHANPPVTPPPVNPAPPATSTPSPSAPVKLDAGGARYVPGESFRDLGDGRLVAVYAGRRLVVKDGSAQVIDATPLDDLGRAHRIPDPLGGGFVFIGERSVWFGPSFEGALTKIVLAPERSGELRVGIGKKSLLVGVGNTPPELYELPSGKTLPLSPAGAVDLFGIAQGSVAAVTRKGELYFSSSGGSDWKKLGAGHVERLAYDGKGIVVYTDKAELRLSSDGKLSPRPNEPGMVVANNVDAFEPFPDMTKPPPEPSDAARLSDGLVRLMSADVAIGLHEADLVFLDAKSGKIEKTLPGAFSGHTNCFVIRGGEPSFIGCNEQEFRLFRVDAMGQSPVLERTLKGVYTQDFGEPAPDAPLAYPRRCDGTEKRGAACLRQSKDVWKDVGPPSDPGHLLDKVPFMIHTAVSKQGRVFEFGWLDGGGDLVIVDSGAKNVRRIPKANMPAWSGGGVDWHALTIENGTLRFLISSRHSKPGVVEIRPDDSVHGEQLDGRVSAEGSRALRISADGKLFETVDAGHDFHEVPAPPGGLPREKSDFFGCRETGCALGPWYRLGWGR